MARSNRGGVDEVDAPEVEYVTDETDEVETVEESSNGEAPKEPKAKKEPARGDLEEGIVTPVQFAKVLTERKLHTDKNGSHEVKPQMVYSYIRNASKEDPAPFATHTDSIGKERFSAKLEDALAWWERKNQRVSERKANAQAKAQKKAENAAKKAEQGEEVTEAEGTEEVVEAE